MQESQRHSAQQLKQYFMEEILDFVNHELNSMSAGSSSLSCEECLDFITGPQRKSSSKYDTLASPNSSRMCWVCSSWSLVIEISRRRIFPILVAFIWDLHIINFSLSMFLWKRDWTYKGGKRIKYGSWVAHMISWPVAQFNHPMEAALVQLFLWKLFLQQQLWRTTYASGISIRPMLLLHITIPAQGLYQDWERRKGLFNCAIKLRSWKTGHVNYGCDGLEGSQTALESARICGKMVLRPIHAYGFEEDAHYSC